MLPIYERLDTSQPVVQISFQRLAWTVVSLPFCAFTFCVMWCLLFDFERSTFTHCEVSNYLPSLSAAIGNYEPQRTVWSLAIIIHFPARIALARLYFQHFCDTIRRNRRVLYTIAAILHVIENFALLGLSLWTSSDDYPRHRNCFIAFIACSESYMVLTYMLMKNGRNVPLLAIEERSLRYKRNLFVINIVCFMAAGYCFMRHNARCEPGVYTFFALFEYIVVLTNMGYHITAVLDFHKSLIVFDWTRGLHLSQMH